ncbi:MAG: phage holin family protein [Desulfocurvibacter africanus]
MRTANHRGAHGHHSLWLLLSLAIAITAWILPGVRVRGTGALLATAAVLDIINALIWPILFRISIPITILTLSLFSLVLNALLVMLATRIVPGFGVDSFWWAIAFSIILAIANAIFHATGKRVRELPITLDKLL